jgi:hypothetical protein
MINDYESESLGTMYGLIRQELVNVTTSIVPWSVQLRRSYDTITIMGGFSESDLLATSTLNQNISDNVRPLDLMVSTVSNVVAPATQLTCLQVPTSDALTRSGDSGGHLQWGISRILRVRAYLDLLAFYRPSPLDYVRVIPGTGGGALPLFVASHESNFKVTSDCYITAAHRVLGFIVERASHVRKCPRCNEAPSESRGYGYSSTVSGISMSDERSTYAMLMDHIPQCPCSW